MKALKWIGGAVGWVMGGPLGGLLGFAVGHMFEGLTSGKYALDNPPSGQTGTTPRRPSRPETGEGDFGLCLLVLSAAVMKADQQVKRSELDFVKAFFKRQFGQEKAAQYILILRELLQKDYQLDDICGQIRHMMDYASRLQLLHYLFGLSLSDGQAACQELEIIQSIAHQLGLSQPDFESVKAMFVKDATSAYKVLEITPDATDEEVKKAYKKMAVKHHPDKVSHLGEDVRRQAEEKFKEINAAYEQIKKERGLV